MDKKNSKPKDVAIEFQKFDRVDKALEGEFVKIEMIYNSINLHLPSRMGIPFGTPVDPLVNPTNI